MIESYTLLTLIIFFVGGLFFGAFFMQLKTDIKDISENKFHPSNSFKIPLIWYKYVYELKTEDKICLVEFYVNNTQTNNDVLNAIYETINCARNEMINNSVVNFIKPVYDTILLNDIQNKHIDVSFKHHSVVKSYI